MSRLNFLEVEDQLDEPDFFSELDQLFASGVKRITPIPGYCVKAKTNDGCKVFINVCHSMDIPSPPKNFVAAALIKIKDNKDEPKIKVPLSIGEAHLEWDKSGTQSCGCYDVVLNSRYYCEEVSKSEVVRDFIATVAVSGIEQKYDVGIVIETCTVLKKNYHGVMPPHFVTTQPSGGDSELLPVPSSTVSEDIILPGKNLLPVPSSPVSEDIILPVKNLLPFTATPGKVSPDLKFKLFQSPASGRPVILVFQGLTQGVEGGKPVRVFVSERKLTVRSFDGKTMASVGLPLPVMPGKAMSNFLNNRLIVTMPVLKE